MRVILLINLWLYFLIGFAIPNDLSKIDPIEIKLSNSNGDERLRLLYSISEKYYQQENYAKAISYKLEEQNYYIQQKNDSMLANCNERLGLMYYHIGNYNQASEHLIKSLSFYESNGDLIMEGQIVTNLANVYTRLENHSKAIKYLKNAEKIFLDSSLFNNKTLSALYTNLGLAFSGNNMLDSAMYYYNKALNLTNEKEVPVYVASILNNIGEVEFEKGNYEAALENYQKSLDLFTKSTNHKGMGAAISNIAKVKIKKQQFNEAIILCKEALNHFKKINSLYFIVSTNEQLYYAYKGKGDHKKALEILESYNSFKDSLSGSETIEYIANLEMQYATQKEKQKFKLLEQESELREKELKLKQLYLYITIGGILFTLLITILTIISLRANLQRNKLRHKMLKQEQEKLELSLNYKQKEVESFANYLKEKNQLLENLKKELNSTDLPQSGEAVKKLTGIINQYLHIDNDRKNLELKIDQQHQEFVQRLQDKYNQLTSNDIRLCSLILLDLNSKEIATILNIEPSSVKMSKNRLRKKLNLPQGENLRHFLNNI